MSDTVDTRNQLWDRQKELEDIAGYWGSSRFQRRNKRALQEKDATRLGAARKLLIEAVGRTEKAISLWAEQQKSGRGRRHTALKWVDLLGYDTSAYLTSKVVLGNIALENPVRVIANKISELMLDEVRCRRFRELAPGLFHYRMAKFQTSSRVHMARSIQATMSKALCQECRAGEAEHCPHLDTSDLRLPQNQRLLIGTLLIRLFQEAFPGWLEKRTDRIGRRTETLLEPTEHASQWIKARNGFLEDLLPVALPMVVPPLPWGNPERAGGYRYGLYDKFNFVRGTRKHRAMVKDAPIPIVYEAVNRIQETPWRINWAVWDTMKKIEDGGGGLAGFPEFEPVPMPPRPPELDAEDFDRELLQAWKERKSAAHEEERKRQGEIRKWINLKTITEILEEESAIWFPHNLDFRGRVYPIPPFLSPQGDDRSKALLEFADGEPLGGTGAFWLGVHGSNCLGKTPGGEKMSRWTLEERSEWIQEQSLRIRDTALEPFSDLWWTEADSPWQFLAFCFTWTEMLQEEDPTEYVCYLPVSMDGTCNGLQHFAGILRDPKTAKAVNVLPSSRPNDVYQIVADAVLDLLEAKAGGSDYARRWLASGLVDRNICKRPTMTFPYGSKPFGFTDQIVEYLRLDVDNWEAVKEEHFIDSSGDEPFPVYKQASAYLAEILWEALNDKVEGAFNAMSWLQDCAREISKSGKAVQWTVPETEFPVIQDNRRYFDQQTKRVETHLAGGVVYRPRYYEKVEDRPDSRRQANAVSPNLIHSLDAAALQKTVQMASHDGVQHFAMVHDSFGTHPSKMETLLEATRQSFFHLYSRHDVVEQLYHEWLNQVDDLTSLEPPPSLGTLDISQVLASDYFFA